MKQGYSWVSIGYSWVSIGYSWVSIGYSWVSIGYSSSYNYMILMKKNTLLSFTKILKATTKVKLPMWISDFLK
jgi:hypothetical protein